MATFTVNTGNANDVIAALVASAGGDTILVGGGVHTNRLVRLNALVKTPAVTIRAANPNNPPIFTGTKALEMRGVEGLTLDGIHFVGAGNTAPGTQPQNSRGFWIENTRRLTIRNCRFSNFDIALMGIMTSNNTFVNEDVLIEYNRFDRWGVDGIRVFSPTHRLTIQYNVWADSRIFVGVPGPGGSNLTGTGMFWRTRHPDMIQMSRNTGSDANIAEDVIIRHNLFTDQSGNSHGFLMAGNTKLAGFKFRRVLVQGNDLSSGRGVGMVSKACDGLTMIGNRLRAVPSAVNARPYLSVGDEPARNLVIHDNVHWSTNNIPFEEPGFSLAAGGAPRDYQNNVRSNTQSPPNFIELIEGVNVGPYAQFGTAPGNPPVVAPIPNLEFPVSTTQTHNFAQYVSGTGPFTYAKAAGSSATLAINAATGVGTFTMPGTPGAGVFRIKATNAAGTTTSNQATITGIAATPAPQLVSPIPDLTRTVSTTTTYDASQHFSGAASYSVTGDGQVSINSASGLLTFTGGATSGNYSYTVTASNGGGSVNDTAVLTLEPAAPTPPAALTGDPGDGRIGNTYLTEIAGLYSGVAIIAATSEAFEIGSDASRLEWQRTGDGDAWSPFRVATPATNSAGSLRFEMRPRAGMTDDQWGRTAGLTMDEIRVRWFKELWSAQSTNAGSFTAPGTAPPTELPALTAGMWAMHNEAVSEGLGRFGWGVVTTDTAPAYTALQYDLNADGVWRNFADVGLDGMSRTIWAAQPSVPGGLEHTVGYDETTPPIRLRYFSNTEASPASADSKTFTGPPAPEPVVALDPGDLLAQSGNLLVVGAWRIRVAPANRPAVVSGDIRVRLIDGVIYISGFDGPPVGAERAQVRYAGRSYPIDNAGLEIPAVEGEDLVMIRGIDADGVAGLDRLFWAEEVDE